MINKDGVSYSTVPGDLNFNGSTQSILELSPPQYINGFLVKHVLIDRSLNLQPFQSTHNPV
jgi:hypothetical protein